MSFRSWRTCSCTSVGQAFIIVAVVPVGPGAFPCFIAATSSEYSCHVMGANVADAMEAAWSVDTLDLHAAINDDSLKVEGKQLLGKSSHVPVTSLCQKFPARKFLAMGCKSQGVAYHARAINII